VRKGKELTKVKTYTLESEIEIGGKSYAATVDGRACRATPAISTWDCPMGYPGDPADASVEHIWVHLPTGDWDSQKKDYIHQKFDFVTVVSEDLINEFEQLLIEEAAEDHGRDYDDNDDKEEEFTDKENFNEQ
jgi:hypothetical protein